MDNNDYPEIVIKCETLFHIEGDNVFFRGLETNRKLSEGYSCPLFDHWIALVVARYISTPERTIRFERDMESFIVTLKSEQKRLMIRKFRVGDNIYYDFAGTERWKID